MQDKNKTIFNLKTIKSIAERRDEMGELLPSWKFFIPAYQRGYRWRREEVRQLLNDIWEFNINKHNQTNQELFYCLQPVVVKKCINKDFGDYEVIDGQQRLTTLFIILQAINHYSIKKLMPAITNEMLSSMPYSPIYSINYETRESSDVWLSMINNASFAKDNIDYFFIHQAYSETISWLESMEKEMVTDPHTTLKKVLLDDVRVIWYEAHDEEGANNEAIDIFNRLNSGKIELNNAELIKALLLQERNFITEDGKTDVTRQSQIAIEWDNMEKMLQREDFWWFIYNSHNPLKYETRLEYIFDLMTKKTQACSYRYTFDVFYQEYKLQDNKSPRKFVEEKWREIQNYMLTLQQWFEDRVLYHYIGYLVEYSNPQDNLIQNLKNLEQEVQYRTDGSEYRLNKEDFLNCIKEMIRNVLRIKQANGYKDVEPSQLRYNSNNNIVRKILLLYNMQSILNTKNSEYRFPLDLYKKEQWDVEHISSQTDFKLSLENSIAWAQDIICYLTGIENNSRDNEKYMDAISEASENLMSEEKKLLGVILELFDEEKNKEELRQNVLSMVNEHFQVNKVSDRKYSKNANIILEDQKDYIWNLALLNSSINRSYGNAIFPIKRMFIIDKESKGMFVPLCTKNTFLKVYSKKLNELMCWTTEDASTYWQNICKVLGTESFLPQSILNHQPNNNQFLCQN